jgi:hypothetical protein
MTSRTTPAAAVTTYKDSVARSRVRRCPNGLLRHTRAEKRCDRRSEANSTTATTAAAATQPHEPQNSATAAIGAARSTRMMNTEAEVYDDRPDRGGGAPVDAPR